VVTDNRRKLTKRSTRTNPSGLPVNLVVNGKSDVSFGSIPDLAATFRAVPQRGIDSL